MICFLLIVCFVFLKSTRVPILPGMGTTGLYFLLSGSHIPCFGKSIYHIWSNEDKNFSLATHRIFFKREHKMIPLPSRPGFRQAFHT